MPQWCPKACGFVSMPPSKIRRLAGAKLAIEEMPVVAKCKDCNAQWTIDEPVFICKTCQSGSLEILSGRELDIESIEVVEEVKNDSG